MQMIADRLVQLELPDLIRMNQLVRGATDFAGFQRWYESLSLPEQVALIVALAEYAYQTGEADDAVVRGAALEEAGLHGNAWLIDTPRMPGYGWGFKAPAEQRFVVFKKFVYLFGKAERNVYCHRPEGKESCNHWWHRNLLDPRVIRDLLNDPQFYRTAKKDDDRVQGRFLARLIRNVLSRIKAR